MSSSKLFIILAIFGIILCSCGHSSQNSWTSAIPHETSFILLPADSATIKTTLQKNYIPFIEDISSSAVQLVGKIDSNAAHSMAVHSILLYPGTDQKFQPIWVTSAPDDFKKLLEKKYAKNFAQNKYKFHDVTILNLRLGDRHMFVARLNNFLLISESSLGIENAIRAYRGIRPGVNLDDIDMTPGSLIMNTPSLDKWVSQLARVKLQPTINHAFKGTYPALLTVKQTGKKEKKQYHFSGTVPLSDDEKTPFINALSSENKSISLDRYISSNAAAFGIFHAAPLKNFPESLPDTSKTDAFFLKNSNAYSSLAKTLDTEFGMVMFAESGFLSKGEYLFLRKLKNPQKLRQQLEELSQKGIIKKIDADYFVQSYGLAQLLGSRLCNFKDFYINITGDATVVSKRKGLAERVTSDRDRRRVVTYDSFYMEMQKNFPDDLSSIFVTEPAFISFLTPFLTTDSNINALTSTFKYTALTTHLNPSGNSIDIDLSTFNKGNSKQPYRENWRYNTGGAELSGKPAFGNIGGSHNDEVVFATKTGGVYALTADGSVVQRYNTGSDVPIGSPVIYDWYRNGQNVVLIAAGNKVYGWDENAKLLPRFPFELNEDISTPLTVADINNNQQPDAIVGTVDRKVHVLNGRGNDLSGWPVTTNAAVSTAPLVGLHNGRFSIIAFAANTVHGWNAAGHVLSDFPQFINAEFRGSPVSYKNAILGNAVDGNLYAIGNQAPFPDSLNVYRNKSSSKVEAIYVSNSALVGTPFVHDGQVLTTSSNGSVFLLNGNGQLQFTKNMGQPSASGWSSVISDINSDGHDDIVSLADYGRLYAWQIADKKRFFDLPTAGMSHVSMGDLDKDGLIDLVAQTESGVQRWTINKK